MAWFTDDFNRANEELGASSDWTERRGDGEIVSNQVENQDAAEQVHHIGTTPITGADYYVEAVINYEATGGGGFLGVIGRRVNNGATDSDMYIGYVRASVSTAYAYYYTGGSFTLIDSGAVTINTATDYTIRLNMNGTTISVDIDTVEIASGTNASLSASGDAGLTLAATGAVAGVSWDNFVVDTLAAGTTETVSGGTIIFKGYAVTEQVTKIKTASRGNLLFKGYAVTESIGGIFTKTAAKGNILLKGYSVTEQVVKTKTIARGNITLGGYAISETVNKIKAPVKGLILLKGYAITEQSVKAEAPLKGAIIFKGRAVTERVTKNKTAAKGQILLKGHPVTGVLYATTVSPVKGTLIFRGYTIGATTAGLASKTASKGSLIFKGNAITEVNYSWSAIAAATGSWSLIASAVDNWSAIGATTSSWSRIH